MESSFYAGLLITGSVISAIAIVLLWKRRKSASALPLICLMASLSIWSGTYALRWLSTTPETRSFWMMMTYLGVVTTPLGFVFFALAYTERIRWITQRTVMALSAFPLVTLVIILTDPLHGLFFGDVPLTADHIHQGGIWFWLNTFYAYGLILISCVLIVRAWFSARGIYRQQTMLILFALSIPIVFNVGAFIGINPLPDIDSTPLLFSVTGLMIIYALYYKRWLDLVPIARDQIMQVMQEPFFLIDQHDRIIDLNEIAHRLFSAQPEQPIATMIGAPITNVFPNWHPWLAAGGTEGEFERVAESDERQIYEWRMSQVRDQQGNIRGRVVLLNNITRRKLALQRELELTLERERVLLLQQFIQNTAHEIRTPLTILGSNIYLLTRMTDPEKRAAKAEIARSNIDRITHVLDMALLMVELEHSPDREFLQVDLRIVLRGVIDGFASRYADQLTFQMRFDEPVTITGSVRLIAEALRQVVDNACRYSPQHSVISTALYRDESCAIIEVTDQGAGIAPDELPLIFNTLYRKDTAHSTQGFGLGLTITRKIIDIHGGKIEIDSAVGQGTTVRLLLPLQTNSEHPADKNGYPAAQ